MHTQRRMLYFLRVTADTVGVLLAALSSIYFFSIRDARLTTNFDFFLLTSLAFSWYFLARMTGLYDEFRSRNFSYELVGLMKNILIQILVAIVVMFIAKNHTLPRLFIVLYAAHLLIILSIERFLVRRILNFLRRKGRNLRHLLIIGAGEVGTAFNELIRSNSHFGYAVTGFLDDQSQISLNGKLLGKVEDLESVLQKLPVDDVIVALPTYATEKIDWIIKICDLHTRRVRIIPDYFRFVSDKFEVRMFGRFPLISVRKIKMDEAHWYIVKRCFDAFFALAFMVLVLSWLVPIIAIAIKLTSRGPVFFKQERWGRQNKKIICYKFRTMISQSRDVDDSGKYQQATKDDPRITPLGRFLRKTNLDELPQFWNVLMGQMSVVGPRPHPTPLNMESKEVIENYMLRHLVKPGITGWAQVNGYRGETRDPELMQKRVNHDIWYIENWSFWLDIQIIFLTVWQMIKYDTKGY